MSEPDKSATDASLLAAGERLFERPWRFLKSVPALEFLPPAARVEIAFAGRSNVGKSSLINALLRQNGLARTSNTPGRTQELNYFLTDDVPLYLVDMPGYGFAKAPKEKVDAWTALVSDYLRGRPTLARVLLLIDARHGLKPVDETIMEMLDTAAVSYQVVLTKADKISAHALAALREATTRALKTHAAAFPDVIATSAAKGAGIAELRAAIAGIVAERS
jgi:GTP-binding protein